MKKTLLFFLSIAAAAFIMNSCGGKAIQEEPDDPAADIVGTFDYGKMAQLGHPRLMMTAQDFKDLKVKITKKAKDNPVLCEAHEMVMKLADQYLADEEVVVYKLDASGKRLLGPARNALRRIFALAYAYRLTGDKRYFEAARKNLAEICAFKDWHPSHYLDTGEMTLGAAIAYDWLYDDLTLEERTLAHKCMVEFGINTSVNQGYHRAMGNWNQVCNAGISAAAIVLYEKDKQVCADAIERAIESNRKAMKAIYSPDGNYAEGYVYWGYGTGFQTMFLKMLDTAFGDDAGLSQTEGYLKSGEYMLFMATPNGGDFSYADGGTPAETINVGMWWFAAKQNDETLAMNELRLMREGKYGSKVTQEGIRMAPAVPCFIKDCGFKGEGGLRPAKDMWYGQGKIPVAIVHTGWTFDDKDVYLGIKGGYAAGGHGHMDAGSFVFEAEGVRWSEDLQRPNYSTMENAVGEPEFWSNSQKGRRWDIMRMNNLGHSTLTFLNPDGSVKDKIHPTDHNVMGEAKMIETYDTKECMGARLDMTGAVSDQVASAIRTIQLIDGKTLKITDEITAKPRKDAKMQWRMLTTAKVEAKADGEVLSLNGKTRTLKTESSDPRVKPAYEVFSMKRPSNWVPLPEEPDDSKYDVAGFSATIPAGKTVTFTTVLSQ